MSRVIVAAVAALVFATQSAMACSCAPPNPKRAEARADILFEGRVLEQRPGVDLAGRPAAVIRVKVDRMLKGRPPASGAITVFSAPDPAACGVDYTGGFSGRFGPSMHTGGLYLTNCGQFELNLDRYRR